jgi:hypothetical protein
METTSPDIDRSRIKSIIHNRLSSASLELQQLFPEVLRRKPILWATICEPTHLILVFLNPEDKKRIEEFVSKRINPFPGLITIDKGGAAFRIEKAKYMTISSCRVENSYTFSLGQDSTVILVDHQQTIKTRDMGTVSYTIPLAYILSYGEEIDGMTVYDYLDGLIAFSENMWRKAGA